MKINNKVLSIPPYISTSWNSIKAIHMKGTLLVITLTDGDSINIPGLDPEIVEQIFESHSYYLENREEHIEEKDSLPSILKQLNNGSTSGDSSFRLGFNAMDNLGAALQHNPAQANAPNLPEEILDKIQAIAKIVSPEEAVATPEPEPHCNCFHCQIARAIQGSVEEDIDYQEDEVEEEDISEEELSFQQWDIKQTGEKIFQITNKLDEHEQYNVCLKPIGCTCGQDHCEHIVAVLKS